MALHEVERGGARRRDGGEVELEERIPIGTDRDALLLHAWPQVVAGCLGWARLAAVPGVVQAVIVIVVIAVVIVGLHRDAHKVRRVVRHA